MRLSVSKEKGMRSAGQKRIRKGLLRDGSRVATYMKEKWIPLSARILAGASVVGYKEKEGPLGGWFDFYDDRKGGADRFGQPTFEQAENEMQRMALNQAMGKSGVREEELDAIFAGDLMNQCTGSAYGLLDFDVPYFGLYGACSTAVEGLLLSAMSIRSGAYDFVAAVASSHNSTAERQYRTPLEYGAQRPPTAQWTVTGAGAFILGRADAKKEEREKKKEGVALITAGMPGIVVDKGIRDSANMGAAMAPAAADTLLRCFAVTGHGPEDYDAIITGDLGYEGGEILCDLLRGKGVDIRSRYDDCGRMIFQRSVQDTHAGGSGCGCSAVVLASYLLPKLEKNELKKILFLGTGALMSPDSVKQGLSIPGIAHLLQIEHGDA